MNDAETPRPSDAENTPPSSGRADTSPRPPRRQLTRGSILFAVILGVMAGVGTFTFGYGRGASYLSNDPQTCANCHVMQEHLDSWAKSTHHDVAVCNDCHLPHHPVGKWLTKADNGLFHSVAFTTGDFKNPIQIKPRNRQVTQDACVHCHRDFVHSMLPVNQEQETQNCVHCHQSAGHAQR
ncbi:MAG: cytochrome c nitrite reductase small subunit [Planctomycetota bacterium]